MPTVKHFCCDNETGETLTYSINKETGEPCVVDSLPTARRFQTNSRKDTIFPTGYGTRTKKFRTLKANIMAGANPVSHRLLLIPTALFFPSLFAIILMILEIFLHVKCHKKNKTLKDPNLYYRSPFHIVTSIFCGVCREHDSASKIGQLQDKLRHRYDYLRGLAA